MSSLHLVLRLALLPLLGACAVSSVMPPFAVTRTSPEVARPPIVIPVPARRVFQHRKKIIREYDPATDQSRVSVTTHRGTYLLWIQRPRLTFLYVQPGPAGGPVTGRVFLVFRTQDPQSPAGNRLTQTCDGAQEELTVTPVFWLVRGAFTTSQHYMYELSYERLVAFAACRQATLTVGGVRAPFAEDQMEAVRDFVTGLP
jgi:hypothetical protein